MGHPFYPLIIFGIIISVNLIYQLVQIYEYGYENTTDSHSAHFGGAMVGFMLGVIVLRNLEVTKTETILSYICALFLALFISVLISLNFYYSFSDHQQ